MLLTRQLARQDLVARFDETSALSVEDFVEIWFSKSTQDTLHALVESLKKK